MKTKPSQNRLITIFILNLIVLAQTGIVRAQKAATAQQDDQDEVIKVETSLVQLHAVVTDRKGQVVNNLRQEDFEVFENGKPQEVKFFSFDQAPGQHAAPAASEGASVALSPATGPAAATRTPPARTVVIFVDTLHLSPASFLRAKKQLKKFIDEQLTDNDLVAVVVPTGTLGILQQFMRDRTRLKYAIDKISLFQGTPSLFSPYLAARVLSEDEKAIKVAIQILVIEESYRSMGSEVDSDYARGRAREILGREENFRRSSLGILRALSEHLANMKGQRMIAYVSEGFTLMDSGGGRDSDTLSAATSRAVRAGVLIYTFNASGLTVPVENQASTPSIPPDALPDFSDYMSRSEMDQKDVLREIADETGARSFINRNDMEVSLGEMLEENRAYYSLAYYPQEDKENKKVRKLKVQVRNHPDYNIRVQRGYRLIDEPKTKKMGSGPQQLLVQAMLAPLPATAIGVTSTANFLVRGDDAAQSTLQIHIDGNSFQYSPQGQNYQLQCQLSMLVFNQQGQIVGSSSGDIKTALTPDQLAAAKHNGFRFEKRLSLQPGLYQVRVGVREESTGAIGTATSWVEIPDLNKKKLVLSGVFLGQASQEDVPAGNSSARAKRADQPALLAGPKPFKSGTPVFYRFVVYGASPKDAGTQLKIELTQGDTSVYAGNWQPLSERAIRSDSKGLEAGGQLREELPPGLYTLHISVKDAHAKKPVEQTVDFEVVSRS